jgi:hypothetical protein
LNFQTPAWKLLHMLNADFGAHPVAPASRRRFFFRQRQNLKSSSSPSAKPDLKL